MISRRFLLMFLNVFFFANIQMIILPVNVMLVKGHKTGHFQIFSGSLSDYVVRRFCIKQRSWERLETLNRRPLSWSQTKPFICKRAQTTLAPRRCDFSEHPCRSRNVWKLEGLSGMTFKERRLSIICLFTGLSKSENHIHLKSCPSIKITRISQTWSQPAKIIASLYRFLSRIPPA